MSSRPRIRSLAVTLLLSLCTAGLAGLAPARATAQLADWDQEKATEIAQEFSDAVNEIYRSVSRRRTGETVGSGQASAFMRIKDRLRLARNESRHLATALGDGKSREETMPVYKRLMSIVRDVREDARKMFLEEPTLNKIGAARELLLQLSPYYDPNAEANPPGIGRQAEDKEG